MYEQASNVYNVKINKWIKDALRPGARTGHTNTQTGMKVCGYFSPMHHASRWTNAHQYVDSECLHNSNPTTVLQSNKMYYSHIPFRALIPLTGQQEGICLVCNNLLQLSSKVLFWIIQPNLERLLKEGLLKTVSEQLQYPNWHKTL